MSSVDNSKPEILSHLGVGSGINTTALIDSLVKAETAGVQEDIEKQETPASIIRTGMDANTVRNIVKQINHYEYKRRQAPPGICLTKNAFGRARQHPITSGYPMNQT